MKFEKVTGPGTKDSFSYYSCLKNALTKVMGYALDDPIWWLFWSSFTYMLCIMTPHVMLISVWSKLSNLKLKPHGNCTNNLISYIVYRNNCEWESKSISKSEYFSGMDRLTL